MLNKDADIINAFVVKCLLSMHDLSCSYELRHEKTYFCICENKGANQLRDDRVLYIPNPKQGVQRRMVLVVNFFDFI